jgi:hypothetical protein
MLLLHLRGLLESTAMGERWRTGALCTECANSPGQGCPSCWPLVSSHRARPVRATAPRSSPLRHARENPRVLTPRVNVGLPAQDGRERSVRLPESPLPGVILPASLWAPPAGPQSGAWQRTGETGWQVWPEPREDRIAASLAPLLDTACGAHARRP